jgi:hypothetical protein
LCRLQPDLIEVGDPYYLAWSALAAARHLRVPAIAFAHSHVSRMFASRFGSWAGATVDAYLQRLYAGFDLVSKCNRSASTPKSFIRPRVVRTCVRCSAFLPRRDFWSSPAAWRARNRSG